MLLPGGRYYGPYSLSVISHCIIYFTFSKCCRIFCDCALYIQKKCNFSLVFNDCALFTQIWRDCMTSMLCFRWYILFVNWWNVHGVVEMMLHWVVYFFIQSHRMLQIFRMECTFGLYSLTDRDDRRFWQCLISA